MKRPLPSLVIHLKGVDISEARGPSTAAARAVKNFYVLGVDFVGQEERFYGGFLVSCSYNMVVAHDGRLSSASGDYRRGEVLSGR